MRGDASQPESNKNCLQTLFAYILEPEAPSMSDKRGPRLYTIKNAPKEIGHLKAAGEGG